LDVSDPTAPSLAASLLLPAIDALGERGYGLHIKGNTLLAFTHYNSGVTRLYSIDITDPLNPSILGSITLSAGEIPVYSSVVLGNYLYATVASSPSKLVIIDITDPTAPVRVGAATLNTGEGNAISLFVNSAGTYAYLGCFVFPAGKLVSVDISDPTNPARVGVVTLNSGERPELIQGHVVPDNYVYLVTISNPAMVVIVDVSDPASMTRLGAISFSSGQRTSDLGGFIRDGDNLYVACAWSSYSATPHTEYIVSLDISDRANPAIVETDTYLTKDNDWSFCVYEAGYLYLHNPSNVADVGTFRIFSRPLPPSVVAGNLAAQMLSRSLI
jgi:hypothetical protein